MLLRTPAAGTQLLLLARRRTPHTLYDSAVAMLNENIACYTWTQESTPCQHGVCRSDSAHSRICQSLDVGSNVSGVLYTPQGPKTQLRCQCQLSNSFQNVRHSLLSCIMGIIDSYARLFTTQNRHCYA
ncbi:hypothetical protein BaRGS_00006549 [Batillaria attramentaria]|uniref:Uncharacterized protein n=1 Tax=Batillaria attramentaria TaxID=370345 RepID=A0ABD0LSC1_9CAEN